MYVSVPKNYSGIAFARENTEPRQELREMPRLPPLSPPTGAIPISPPVPSLPPRLIADAEKAEPEPKEAEKSAPRTETSDGAEDSPCAACREKEHKNPLTCLFEALHGRERSGLDAEDFLLIGLIALLMNKEGNEEIVFILALLLLT